MYIRLEMVFQKRMLVKQNDQFAVFCIQFHVCRFMTNLFKLILHQFCQKIDQVFRGYCNKMFFVTEMQFLTFTTYCRTLNFGIFTA